MPIDPRDVTRVMNIDLAVTTSDAGRYQYALCVGGQPVATYDLLADDKFEDGVRGALKELLS